LKSKKKKKAFQLSWVLYLILAILIVAYAVFNTTVLGLAVLLTIAFIFYYEIRYSIKTEGARKSIIDIGSAIGVAVLVWIILIIILHTTAPVDAVSSCSMLPELHRGDLVVLSGIVNITKFLESSHVPVVKVSQSAFASMEANMSSEFLSYFAYFNGNKSKISYIFNSSSNYSIGLYNASCLSKYAYMSKPNYYYKCYSAIGSQSKNLVKYNYSIGRVSVNGVVEDVLYTSVISINNTSISENYSNPIIVYQTTKRDYFSGSIIHRLYAVINASGNYYFLTKGDNNQALDIEFSNYPANASSVLGYVVADIPVLGYVKLILSGQLAQPAGCNQTIITR
jgi:hypothetical protein